MHPTLGLPHSLAFGLYVLGAKKSSGSSKISDNAEGLMTCAVNTSLLQSFYFTYSSISLEDHAKIQPGSAEFSEPEGAQLLQIILKLALTIFNFKPNKL